MTCKCVLNELTQEEIRTKRLWGATKMRKCLVCDKWFDRKGKKIYCSADCRVKHAIDSQESRERAKDRQLEGLEKENEFLLNEIATLKAEIATLKAEIAKLRRGECD